MLKKKIFKNGIKFFGEKKITFRVIEPNITCCGLSNLYNNPKDLGSDRWCAAIGAFSLKEIQI